MGGHPAFNFLEILNRYISLFLLIPLLIACGLWFSFRTKFVQFRLLKDAIKSLSQKAGKGKVSTFQSLMISTAARVGVGHISGIASAIVLGGPGAILWMWIMTLFTSASAFIESTLAQIYKVKDGKGFRGGPAYYIEKGLGNKKLGIFFACLLIAGYAYGFNALQSFQLASAFEAYIPNYENSNWPLIIGIVLAILTALTIWGGVHRIGFISSYVVPVMALMYIGLGLFAIFTHLDKMPAVISEIFKGAFTIEAFSGALIGRGAMLMGIKRGLLSNEAGMGSAPNVAASADVPHPVVQGAGQIFGVFLDTLIICSTTAFIVLFSNVDINSGLRDVPLVEAAAKSHIGEIGVHIVAISILLFAFSSIIGNYCYAENNILFIKDNKIFLNIFRATCILTVFFGTQLNAHTVWNIADLTMSSMAIVNILVMLSIGEIAVKALWDYLKKKKAGGEIKFKAKDIGLENTDFWN